MEYRGQMQEESSFFQIDGHSFNSLMIGSKHIGFAEMVDPSKGAQAVAVHACFDNAPGKGMERELYPSTLDIGDDASPIPAITAAPS
jgi:hypothetical protein